MKLEICAMCYSYEKRFNWMVSSLCDCLNVCDTDIVLNVSTPQNNVKDYDFITKDICDYYKNRTHVSRICDNIKLTNLSDDTFSNRALQRNFQVQFLDQETDLVLFADCDHIYDPLFFDEFIQNAVRHRRENGINYMYTSRRTSTDELNKLNILIDEEEYPSYVDNTVGKYKQLKTRVTSAPGAGNCQLVFKEDLGGVYLSDYLVKDKSFFNSITYKSDRQFRKRFKDVIKIETESKQYHLQHERYSFEDMTQQ